MFLTNRIKLTSHRTDKLMGRSHLVFNVTMLVPGVLYGSAGAVYYPDDEVSKHPHIWNHIPVVINHPEAGSAKDKNVLNASCVGLILNSQYSDSKLIAEAWIDEAVMKDRNLDLYNRLVGGSPVEVSTGLNAALEDVEPTVYNNVTYTKVAKQYKPDHLALLPDNVGACSIADGCGINNSRRVVGDAISAAGRRMWSAYVGKYITNEMSNEDLRFYLSEQVEERFRDTDGDWDTYLVDVYPISKFVIFAKEGKFFKLGYSVTKDGAQLSVESPEEVVRVTQYEPVKNEKEDGMLTAEQKKGIVDSLVTNCKCAEKDRESLMNLSDEALTGLSAQVYKTPATTPTKPEEKTPATVVNLSREELLDALGPDVKNAITYAIQAQAAQKASLIEQITNGITDVAVKATTITSLQNQSVEQLALTASIVNASKSSKADNVRKFMGTDFGGSGGGTADTNLANQSGEEEEGLGLPVLNWDEEDKSK